MQDLCGCRSREAMPKRERTEWAGLHCLAVAQFDEAMLLELFDVASRMKAMVAAKGKSAVLAGKVLIVTQQAEV